MQRPLLMNGLPILLDTDDALSFYRSQANPNNPMKAIVVGLLAKEGYQNRDIREALNIRKVYTVTHLLRVSKALTDDEMDLWYRNPERITLGHLRAIAKFPHAKRESLIRRLLTSKIPVHQFEALARGEDQSRDIDIQNFVEKMSEATGRPTTVTFNKKKQAGTLTLTFFDLNDFDALCRMLGYKDEEDF
jgi:ParB family chromosome partitioning protein